MKSHDCKECGVVSIGTFIVAGAQFQPHCQNDFCPSQWWNRVVCTARAYAKAGAS